MRLRRISALLPIVFLAVAACGADNKETSAITEQHRVELIRTFNSDLVYIRTQFPMGKVGLTLKDGKISPSGEKLQELLALWGPSVKPGDRAMITKFDIHGDRIHFEINGGPVRKAKWYQHIQVGMNGGMASPGGGQTDPINNPRGSYVDLVFDHHIPDLTAEQLKQMLLPVFDFDSKSPLDAYLESVPPKAKQAIKDHHVLVGMNREMVIYAKGRPEKKIREKQDDGTEYEDWIYGEPPQDVDFVRVIGDEVVRVETMKVGGEKMVRTEKEIDLGGPGGRYRRPEGRASGKSADLTPTGRGCLRTKTRDNARMPLPDTEHATPSPDPKPQAPSPAPPPPQ